MAESSATISYAPSMARKPNTGLCSFNSRCRPEETHCLSLHSNQQMLPYPKETLEAASVLIGFSSCHLDTTVPLGTKKTTTW